MTDFVTHDGRTHTALRDLPSAAYHADAIDDTRPSLSASIAKFLIDKSPAHARVAHPRLNPDYQREDDQRFDVGTSAHSLFLEGIDKLAVIPFDDWRSKAAKELRDDARANGLVPLLSQQADEVYACVQAIRAQCDSHPEGPFFTDGAPEKTLVWTDDYGVLCRARLDWILDDHTAIHDLKTTKASASPYSWDRTGYAIGIDVQAAFYLRGCERVLGVRPEFLFVAVEVAPPYALSVFGLTPEAYELANKKIDFALRTWATCLRNDAWPAYPSQIAYLEPPPWLESQWLAKELREVAA